MTAVNEAEVSTTSPRRLDVPPDTTRTGRYITSVVVVVTLAAAHLAAFDSTEFQLSRLIEGWTGIARFLGEAFPPDLSKKVLSEGSSAAIQTLWVGLLGTTLSVPGALLLAVLGARTISPHPVVYHAARSVLSFFRAVPDVVFALIFVTAVGLGPFAGVLALIVHNIGVMGKLWSEQMEEIDRGPQEALRTAGLRRGQVVMHATLPLVVPQLTGLLLYRFDVNVRSSLVLGLVGAGGIGLLINKAIKSFQFDQMLTYIILVLVLVVLVDLLSAAVRRRLQA